MYNKIASLILNSGKNIGFSDVFVAQPDSLKENLAGKAFVLAEINSKKAEGQKIFDFLIDALENYYYNDEKLALRGKIENLRLENIFEAALTKINKSLVDFLAQEKIKINPVATNMTIGVIYENKLYFATFGHNKALLIYRRRDDYEIINVEANATEASHHPHNTEAATAKVSSFFSSVISGEIPANSYFIFTNETLPEYLSNEEMMRIITKLPPLTASEQIKNSLSGMNTYVPFLGIIIKNTVGLPGSEAIEEAPVNVSAQTSISSLNSTEQRTENMLAPIGLINFPRLFKNIKESLSAKPSKTTPKEHRIIKQQPENTDKSSSPLPEMGKVRSLNMARADSFMIKEKIFFKKKSGWLVTILNKISTFFAGLFSSRFLTGFSANLKTKAQNLNEKNRLLFIVLGLTVLILVVSLGFTSWTRKRQAAQTSFNNAVAAIEDKENLVDSHLLYNDDAGARTFLIDAQTMLNALPRKTSEQQTAYQRLADKLRSQEEKVEKITRITSLQKVNDLSGLSVNNLVFASGQIYGASLGTIYTLKPNSASSTKTVVAAASNLSNPEFNGKDSIYYWDGNQIAQFNLKTKKANLIKIDSLDQTVGAVSYKVFNNNLYLLAKNKNQIYFYPSGKNGFSTKSDWLKESVDLSAASDLAIDGDIYILSTDGSVMRFYKGKKIDYSSAPLTPVMTAANKLIAGSKYIYIFEASSKRLAVLAKQDGHLVSQYIIDSLNQPKDVAIDENGRTAYFLDGETVYKIGLNQ